jgi:hypothetical protein
MKVSIHKAYFNTCLAILSEPQLRKVLPIEEGLSLEDYICWQAPTLYVARAGNYKLLFHYSSLGEGVWDIHIGCPKDSIRASRKLSLAAMQYVAHKNESCFRALTTNCPEGKIANMCRKLGATEIKTLNSRVYFMVTPAFFNTRK